MKHISLIAGALLALAAPAVGQWPGDNFDGYTAGQQLFNVGGWTGWDNAPGAAGTADSQRSRSFPNSIRCGPAADAVHPLIGITSGKWTLTAHQYIPTGGLTGDVYFIVNNVYNHGGPYTWTTQLKCQASNNMVIDDLPRPHTPRPVVFDQWVEYRLEIDLDVNTVSNFYNGALVSSGTYAPSGPRAIQNIDLFNNGGTCNWDDIRLQWRGDSFETYAPATVLSNVGGWFGWDNTPAAAGTASALRARTGTRSILCGPAADAVHPQIGITSGRWTLTAHQYIPTGGLTGDVYFIVNNVYNHGGPYTWTTQLKAQMSNGMVIDDLPRPHTPRPVVFDAWIEYRLDIDLDANTVSNYYNGDLVSRGTYAPSGPRAIQNFDLFNNGGTCSWDDICLVKQTLPPCYETNIGTALALGDDQTVIRPLGFTFTFPGGSTTSIGICSNGYVWLDGAQTASPWANSVLEFLGSAQATPRICAAWRDFDPTATGSDDVYLNTFPDRAVITWHRLLRFGGIGPLTPTTVQLQMLSDGSFYLFYDSNYDLNGGTTNGGRTLIGVKAATGVVVIGTPTDYSTALPISTTGPVASTVYEFFADSALFDLRGRCMRFARNNTGGYEVSFRFDCSATSVSYGVGCPAGTPVTLAASAPPRLGSTINLNVTNVPIGADAGALLLGVSTANINLTSAGFPGCSVYTTMNLVVGLPLTPPTGTLAVTVPIAPQLIGVVLDLQAAVVKNSSPTSTHTSNGLTLVFGKN